ncbi:MAG: ATP-binding protein [Pyrinomonadaceae bacterium]
MLPRYENRAQLALALVVGLLLLANLFTLVLVALVPAERTAQAPVLFTVFIVTALISLPTVVLLPRWLLRPYRQLVSEAERVPTTKGNVTKPRDEAEFVLETFQSIVAQLQAQQRELEVLSLQARARADSAEQFSERIIASVPSGLVAFDAQGRATVINAPARALLEIDPQVKDQTCQILLNKAPALIEMIDNCLTTGALYRREVIAATNADNRVRRLGVTIAPIDSATEGGARGALCLLTDITEVMQLREQVALKRNLESLGEMSAGLAHEFKNALATLHGYAQLLLKLQSNEAAHNAATALLQEVRNLSEMVTSFLNFARPQPLDFTKVSLIELIKECAHELEPFYDERQVQLTIEGEFGLARADEIMLRQALLNLLRNAAEAIDDAARERKVFVRGRRENTSDERIVIEIEDTGSGINEEDSARIFIPFYTTKAKGHGVGLALAHRVITEHNGTLTVANASTGGAVFTVMIPA